MILLPDLANMLEPERAWPLWLALTQLCLAALCLLAAFGPRTYAMRASLVGAALWYFIQAIDERWAGNYFGAGLWEYPILAAWALTIAIHVRHERRKGRA